MNCLICGSDASSGKKISSKCMFTNKNLERIECPDCGVIFGPDYMLYATDEFIASEYEKLYKTYNEGDTTFYGVETFKFMKPDTEGAYVDYGCGRWSKTAEELVRQGYKGVRGYEPYSNSKPSDRTLLLDDLNGTKFDGLFSTNVIEHLRDPLATFENWANLLKPGCKMAHSTACYRYAIEYSQFHLFFFAGRSVEIMCSRSRFSLVGAFPMKDPEYKCCVFQLSK